jgi:hypothetical protein
MASLASLNLQHRRKTHLFTQANVDRLVDAGVGADITATIPAWTGQTDAGAAMEMLEQRQREGVLGHIAEVAAAFPSAGLQAIDFQFVPTSVPNAFTARVAKDESCAIGLDHGVLGLLHPLMVLAMLAQQFGKFGIFGEGAARLVSLFFIGRPVDGLEADLRMLGDKYANADDSTRQIIDGFGQGVVDFVIAHELGHVALGHFLRAKAPTLASPTDGPMAVSAFDHEREFEADAWAMEALLLVAGGDVRRLTFAVAAPFLSMTMLSYVARLHEPTTDVGRLLRATHPPERERAARLRKLAATQAARVPATNALQLLVRIDRFLHDHIEA